MTMPSLIANHREKEYVTKLKKFNSVMNQAIKMAISQNGEIADWGLSRAGMSTDPTDEEKEIGHNSINKFWKILGPQLKIVQQCNYGEPCKDTRQWERHSLDGTRFSYFTPTIVLADGSYIVGTTISNPECKTVEGTSIELQNVCGEIFVDLNGPKLPNVTGKDVFLFYITKFGLTAQGNAEVTTGATFDALCNRKKTSILNGYGCTAWVIYNENMDYLKCDDLSWKGKTKCK